MLMLDHAPEDVLLGFLNTVDIEEGTDVCASPQSWRGWLADRGIRPGQAPRHRCRALRDELRAWFTGDAAIELSFPMTFVMSGPDRPDSTVGLRAADLPGLVGVALAQLQAENRLDRVKICPADDCRWAFYDKSRNHSRTWCSMEICGNREKARKHAAKQRRGDDPTGV